MFVISGRFGPAVLIVFFVSITSLLKSSLIHQECICFINPPLQSLRIWNAMLEMGSYGLFLMCFAKDALYICSLFFFFFMASILLHLQLTCICLTVGDIHLVIWPTPALVLHCVSVSAGLWKSDLPTLRLVTDRLLSGENLQFVFLTSLYLQECHRMVGCSNSADLSIIVEKKSPKAMICQVVSFLFNGRRQCKFNCFFKQVLFNMEQKHY